MLAFVHQAAALVGPQLRRPVAHGSSTKTSSISTSFSTPPPRARLQPLQATAQPTGPFLNTNMLRSIVINQLVVGYSIWILNGDGRQLLAATQFDPVSLGVGVVGGAAVVAVGRFIEKSPNPLFAELNLSTNMLVLRLFGPKPQPILAGLVSLGVATLVALTEETVFRGVVTSRLAENLELYRARAARSCSSPWATSTRSRSARRRYSCLRCKSSRARRSLCSHSPLAVSLHQSSRTASTTGTRSTSRTWP